MKVFFLLVIIYTVNHVSANVNSTKYDFKAAVQKLAEALSSTFQEIVVTELGAEVAGRTDTRTGHKVSRRPPATDDELLRAIADKLRYKLAAAARVLRHMGGALASSAAPSFTHPCPYNSIRKSALIHDIERNSNSSTPDDQMKDHFGNLKIKRKYFLSHVDYATDKDCVMPHSNLRYIYHKVINPEAKLFIFIVDNSVGADAVQYAVAIVKEITRALQPTDMFALKVTNTTDFVKFEEGCSREGTSEVGHATDNNKLLFGEYAATIDVAHHTVPHVIIHQQLGILLAKEKLPKDKLIIFLTDTKVLTDETWPKMFPYPVREGDSIKLAIGVIRVDKNSSLEILHFERWHNDSKSRSLMRVHMNDSGVIGQVASAFISLMPQRQYETSEVMLLTPLWEATARDFIVSLVIPNSAGVFGVDLYWTDLAEDVIYFKETVNERRAFVMDIFGRVIMHSHYPRPELTTEKIKFTHLDIIENYDFIDSVRNIFVTSRKGNLSRTDSFTNKSISYTWEWVENLYMVCVVSNINHGVQNLEQKSSISSHSNKEILFHRLDLFPPKSGKLCRHFKQIATIEQGTVYLSPSSFRSPFRYLHDSTADGEALRDYMQNYLAYIRSVAGGLLSNPGLGDDVQRDAGLLDSLLPYYKQQQLHGAYSRYVVRRYAAADSGVLAMYPGTVLEADYEPVRRAWHARAAARPSRLVLGPPALDVGGAGYVVTLSYALPSPRLVLAMDVTVGFLHKLLGELLPACRGRGARCFVMDSRGYLVSHPGLVDPAGSGPIEQQHVTHEESMIAIDMLNHRSFVTKRLCDNLHDMTVQRYYEFNTSVSEVLSNAVPGEHCTRYYITAIPGADAFVALVNASCSAGAFCPCSMVDRLCLNCNRMEQTECECPCECAASSAERCGGGAPARPARPAPLPPCGRVPEGNNHKSHYFHNFAENLKPCFEWECGARASHAACLGVVGCEWCQLDADARTPLAAPFCAPQAACFSGVLGALTPYGEGTFRDEAGGYSALGPVVGCLVTAGLVAAVAAYCYRQSAGGGGGARAQLYAEGADTWVEPEPAAAGGAEAGRERLLPAPVSPYRVVGGVRCARQGSDHGYSTMTPHEDSEAAGAGGGEPAPRSDVSSCPLPRPPPPAAAAPAHTALPARVLAPVTVHRHMEAS